MEKNFEIKNGQMVAAKNLEAGDVVFREPALVTGPARMGLPVCIACYNKVEGDYYCTQCSWQVCNEECEQLPIHQMECELYKEKEIYAAWDDVSEATLTMDFMGAFRLLLAIKEKPELRKLLTLNMHNEARMKRFNIKYYTDCELVLVKYIRDTCGLAEYSEDEVLTALGLFEMYGTPGLPAGAKAFHPTSVFMGSSCVPNSYSCLVGSQHTLVVRASRVIAKGESITRCLADVDKCNLFRRKDLSNGWFLDCECPRCKDGTEMGTNFGGIISQEFGNKVFVPKNPREEGSVWVSSDGSGLELSGGSCTSQLESVAKKCEEALRDTGGNAGSLEFILSNPGEWDICPKTGQIMMDIKKHLISSYGNMYGLTYDVLDPQKIKNKVEYCNEMLALLDKFHPGRNYAKAMLHYEAANAILGLAMRGDKSLVEEGVRHCELGATICDKEDSESIYRQLGDFLITLKSSIKSN